MNIQTSSSDLYDQLEICITQDDLDGALSVLEDLCRQQSDQAAPWEIRGLLEATAGRPNSAIHYFKRARQYAPLEVWSVRTMALQYVALNKVSIAIETLHSLGMSGQLETSGIRMLSTDLINLGAPELSAEIINNAIKQRPDDPLLWHELSAVQSILGKPASVCLQSAEQAILLSPSTTEFRVTAASILIRMDHLQTAYDLVCHVVTPNRIELDCACCLWRLICLFDTFEDLPRMSICYERLTQIEAAQSQN